ncbi:peptidyl-prolyl cis-trans isomerase [Thalassococcus sp. S3]|uniref:peptidyl-prolyl cis-trans isomerase n=1 Tax=Thalassococcus sp. S3 TaxID=2017482 RepID=UPI0010247CCC|nr:peptidyl-prolyl cis-trans isomerase [Thalassococcus sp. S3]QBF32188.1 peptidylprolyl isomerase [Thalassococcus sp. S3]
MAGKNSISRTLVWILMGLLFVGLAGFGATNLSGNVRTVGMAGEQPISTSAFARELQTEIRAVSAQTGQPLPMSQARAMGLDQIVLGRLVTLASIDNETAQLGISIGDANLQREIVAIPAFQGIDGQFDREAYRFALQQANIREAEFEADLRAEAARTLVQGAITGGTDMPGTFADVIVNYVGARRSFTWDRLDQSDMTAELPTPSDADLQAYYDENGDLFMLPETKQITYVVLTPDDILDQVEVDETALQQLYEDRDAQYNQPERRLIERLVFSNEEAARSALAQIEVNGTTFERLVEDRGLQLSDVDMGDVARPDIGAAGEDVFAAGVGDVVGPHPTPLGPALFRVNGILEARNIPFEDARDDLQNELAAARARRLVEAEAQNIDDLLAGGATLEEVAQETDMTLGQIDWTREARDDIAAYDAFRRAAAAVTEDDFPEVAFLQDGGFFALRLNETLAERPQPFEAARARVEEAWTADAVADNLSDQARTAISSLAEGGDFAEAGLTPTVETGLTRSAFIEAAPDGFMADVFTMQEGEVRVIPTGPAVMIVRLDEVLPPVEGGETEQLRSALDANLDQTLAQALFDAFARDAQIRANPQIDQRALNAVLTSFQ